MVTFCIGNKIFKNKKSFFSSWIIASRQHSLIGCASNSKGSSSVGSVVPHFLQNSCRLYFIRGEAEELFMPPFTHIFYFVDFSAPVRVPLICVNRVRVCHWNLKFRFLSKKKSQPWPGFSISWFINVLYDSVIVLKYSASRISSSPISGWYFKDNSTNRLSTSSFVASGSTPRTFFAYAISATKGKPSSFSAWPFLIASSCVGSLSEKSFRGYTIEIR